MTMKRLIEWLRSVWAAPDKLKHIIVGMTLAVWSAMLIPSWAWILPLLVAAIAGAVKELYDSTGRGTVDRGDFWATLAGGIVVWFAAVAKLLFLCFFILLAPFACSPARNVSSSLSDSVRIEVCERTVFVRDTVWREFPTISEAVTVRADSSHLENRYAVSDARINFDGSLYHHLSTKPQREAIPIDRPVEYRDSIVYRDRTAEKIITVEVERDLTWWQQTQMRGFWLLLAIFVAMIGWRKVKSVFNR